MIESPQTEPWEVSPICFRHVFVCFDVGEIVGFLGVWVAHVGFKNILKGMGDGFNSKPPGATQTPNTDDLRKAKTYKNIPKT